MGSGQNGTELNKVELRHISATLKVMLEASGMQDVVRRGLLFYPLQLIQHIPHVDLLHLLRQKRPFNKCLYVF